MGHTKSTVRVLTVPLNAKLASNLLTGVQHAQKVTYIGWEVAQNAKSSSLVVYPATKLSASLATKLPIFICNQ